MYVRFRFFGEKSVARAFLAFTIHSHTHSVHFCIQSTAIDSMSSLHHPAASRRSLGRGKRVKLRPEKFVGEDDPVGKKRAKPKPKPKPKPTKTKPKPKLKPPKAAIPTAPPSPSVRNTRSKNQHVGEDGVVQNKLAKPKRKPKTKPAKLDDSEDAIPTPPPSPNVRDIAHKATMQKMKAGRKEQRIVPVPRSNASPSSKHAAKPAPSKRIVKPKTDTYSFDEPPEIPGWLSDKSIDSMADFLDPNHAKLLRKESEGMKHWPFAPQNIIEKQCKAHSGSGLLEVIGSGDTIRFYW